ncbi:MAG: 4-hydroxythreonine-4-phosphate dehydrogenase PdxA [Bryobacteraceae bacterium]
MLGVTMGDSSGVGPEILLKALKSGLLDPQTLIFGDRGALEFCNRELGYGVTLSQLNLRDQGALQAGQITPGKLNALSGAAARDYVVEATHAALRGEIEAIVTLPINKEATQLSDPGFTGHTELIGSICKAPDVTIMLVSDKLIVTHVSTHCSLRTAIDRVKTDRVFRIIELTCQAVARLRSSPKIAVAGLNPHAGENGLFGSEDIEEILPAIRRAQVMGYPVEGPHAPDTVFYMAVHRKAFDAVVCMYHDQGHIAAKILDFESAVNVTLGLPIIRTSVDHGTAFDIAYQGIASDRSFERALHLAKAMVQQAG